jgi:hypothetical protein
MIGLTVLFFGLPTLLLGYVFFRPTFDRIHYKVTHPEREIDAATKKEIEKELDRARAQGKDANAALAEGVRTAYGDHLVGRRDLGRCPVRLPTPSKPSTSRSGSMYGSYGLPWETPSAPFPFAKVMASDARRVGSASEKDKTAGVPSSFEAVGATLTMASLSSPSADSLLSSVSSLETRTKIKFREGNPGPGLLHEAQRIGARKLDYDVVFVIERYREPFGVPRMGFTSGYVGGRAFLFDHASKKVACAGVVHAFNSKDVQYEYRAPVNAPNTGGSVELASALRRDLIYQLLVAVQSAVIYRAGEPRGDEPDVDLARLLDDADGDSD